eukprot:TRINITY_DN13064_c0_g1_i7.p1 TRINITY_DN13064_c0_g1~~TRINITY_DN13064_c0_g1_i7.p1  ORF type:complete len:132 (-),score=18.05 TRINITY_DN13064_c0_g1_i7:43-438(-)
MHTQTHALTHTHTHNTHTHTHTTLTHSLTHSLMHTHTHKYIIIIIFLFFSCPTKSYDTRHCICIYATNSTAFLLNFSLSAQTIPQTQIKADIALDIYTPEGILRWPFKTQKGLSAGTTKCITNISNFHQST